MKKWRQLTSILPLVCPCRDLCFPFTWFILFGQGKKFIFIYLRLTFLHLDWTNGALRSYIMCSYRDENSTQFAFCNLTLTVIKKRILLKHWKECFSDRMEYSPKFELKLKSYMQAMLSQEIQLLHFSAC